MKNHKSYCPIYGAFVALLLLLGAAPDEKLNVLFIAVDDLKPALGCYGDALAKTPNLDALAARGTAFTRAYCQQAVCSPSRSSLLTGRRPDTTKVWDLETHFRTALPDVVTLPQHFKAHGWHTQAFGKIYHGGYDDKPSWSVPTTTPKKPNVGPEGQALVKRLKEERPNDDKIRGLPFEAPDVDDASLADGSIADQAIDALRGLKDKPFFLAVGFLRPHLPFVAPKKYWDLWKPADFALPEGTSIDGAPKWAPQAGGELRQYHDVPKSGDLPDALRRNLLHGYYAATAYMDAQLGRVMKELDALGLREKTVVVVWGDHGWHLGDHGMWCKHTNYEQATRAPLIVAAPRYKSNGLICNSLVEFVDVYPTLAELAGLPLPEGLEGTSFAPLLDDAKKPWKKAAFSQYPRGIPGTGRCMGYSMRTERWRFVAWEAKAVAEYELYDLEKDPGETVNLAKKPEHAELVKTLTAQLKAGWKEAKP
ncbi:MAG TPA: sulfatase [Planctomycetota bacterium]